MAEELENKDESLEMPFEPEKDSETEALKTSEAKDDEAQEQNKSAAPTPKPSAKKKEDDKNNEKDMPARLQKEFINVFFKVLAYTSAGYSLFKLFKNIYDKEMNDFKKKLQEKDQAQGDEQTEEQTEDTQQEESPDEVESKEIEKEGDLQEAAAAPTADPTDPTTNLRSSQEDNLTQEQRPAKEIEGYNDQSTEQMEERFELEDNDDQLSNGNQLSFMESVKGLENDGINVTANNGDLDKIAGDSASNQMTNDPFSPSNSPSPSGGLDKEDDALQAGETFEVGSELGLGDGAGESLSNVPTP